MEMSNEQYSALINEAFKILKLKKPKTSNINELLSKLKQVANGPIMSETHIYIHELIRNFAEAVENNEPIPKIQKILENLRSEVDYSIYWD